MTDDANSLPLLGDLPLRLAEPERRVDHAFSDIPVGIIALKAWQITPIPRLPADFHERDAYLIRISYDLEIEPDAPAPRWFEVGFKFASVGVDVNDALPQRVDQHEESRTYVLNGRLAFARQDLPVADVVLADILMPAVAPEVEVFGLGSSMIQWRHLETAGWPIRPGAYLGWIALVVPAGQRQILVAASARFELPAAEAAGLREVAYPDALIIDLPEREPTLAHRASTDGPRVFVSYAHDSDEHKAAVRALCVLLRHEGVNVLVDHAEPGIRQDWRRWMTTGIYRSDRVVVVASPAYRSVGLYEFDDDTHAGAQAEYQLLTSLLRENRSAWMPKILPVILPGRAVGEIPVGLQPHDADHYLVPSLTADGVAELVRAISNGSSGGNA